MLRQSIRCAIASGRHVSLLHDATRALPCAPYVTPSSALAWNCFAVVSSRALSQIPVPEPSEPPQKLQKMRTRRAKNPKASANESARQNAILSRLRAAPGDTDVALEVFAAIQSANGSGLSKDVASTLLTTFVSEKKLNRAVQVLELCGKQKVDLQVPAYANFITCCYKTKDFDAALKGFDLLRGVKLVPSNFVYTTALLAAHKAQQDGLVLKILEQMLNDAKPHTSRAFQLALSAAVKSREHELVLRLMECSESLDVELTSEHYHFVLKSYAAVGDLQAVLGTRDTLQQQGFNLTDDGLHWLVHCACKADHWDLVQDLLAPLTPGVGPGEAVVATLSAFNAAIAAYANKERWAKVVDVYNIMSEPLRAELKGWHLGAVIMGHAKAESKELKLHALEIFSERKEKVNAFAYGGAITALLETDRFDAALALAQEMKVKDITWGKSVYQAVALALIRRGTPEEAVQLLESSVQRMGIGPDGYIDIIQFYTDRHPPCDAEDA
uniref:Pentacotripeptide-repeat region of PRORP domain-containing protein n=1 Tax=Phytophthora ramorum TaxID=164328 RepID=H3GNX4_PHYRM